MISPSYISYRNLWLHIMKGKEVLSKLNLRMSNDTMFLGSDNDRIKELYNYSTKLFVIITTLEDLIYDNPMFNCSDILNDNHDMNNVDWGSDVANRWIDRFSDLFNCLNTTIDRADRVFRTGNTIDELDVICTSTTTDQSNDYDEHHGDYDLTDYNDDYYK